MEYNNKQTFLKLYDQLHKKNLLVGDLDYMEELFGSMETFKLWKLEFFNQYILEKLNNFDYKNILRVLSKICVSLSELSLTINMILQEFNKNPDKILALPFNDRLNLLVLIKSFEIRFEKQNEPFLKKLSNNESTINDEKYLTTINKAKILKEKLIPNLLYGEEFFYCKTKVPFGETNSISLKYKKSIVLMDEKFKNIDTWKLFVYNKMPPVHIENNGVYLSDLNFNLNAKDKTNMNEEYNIKHFLYLLENNLEDDQNLDLEDLFRKEQENFSNSIKKIENYQSFVVEFSIHMNIIQVPYKMSHICPNTKILIDIVLPNQNIGLLFYETIQNIGVLANGEVQFSVPDNVLLMKMKLLEQKGGWKIFLINYENWVIKFDTNEKKKGFMKKLVSYEKDSNDESITNDLLGI